MGLWRDMCPFLFWGAEWLVSILPSAAAVVRCLPCCAPLAGLCGVSAKGGKGGEDANSHAVQGTLCVRTHAPHGAYPETPGNTHFHLSKWTNCIRTTEYTWWNFLPKNLWSQISQPANFYFLVMALMQMVPQISDSDGLPTFLFPLSLVMLITAAKDAYENIKRARADQEENDRVCRLIPAGGEDAGIEMVRWRQLRPGDIVKLHCDEPVPADMMMLNCADEYGVAYLETVQLDGETNLKHKMCIPEIAEIVRSDQQASVLARESGSSSGSLWFSRHSIFSCYPLGTVVAKASFVFRKCLSSARVSVCSFLIVLSAVHTTRRDERSCKLPSKVAHLRRLFPRSQGVDQNIARDISILCSSVEGKTIRREARIEGAPAHSALLDGAQGRCMRYRRSFRVLLLALCSAPLPVCLSFAPGSSRRAGLLSTCPDPCFFAVFFYAALPFPICDTRPRVADVVWASVALLL